MVYIKHLIICVVVSSISRQNRDKVDSYEAEKEMVQLNAAERVYNNMYIQLEIKFRKLYVQIQ